MQVGVQSCASVMRVDVGMSLANTCVAQLQGAPALGSVNDGFPGDLLLHDSSKMDDVPHTLWPISVEILATKQACSACETMLN